MRLSKVHKRILICWTSKLSKTRLSKVRACSKACLILSVIPHCLPQTCNHRLLYTDSILLINCRGLNPFNHYIHKPLSKPIKWCSTKFICRDWLMARDRGSTCSWCSIRWSRLKLLHLSKLYHTFLKRGLLSDLKINTFCLNHHWIASWWVVILRYSLQWIIINLVISSNECSCSISY